MNLTDVNFRLCQKPELPLVIALLKSSELPYEDVSWQKITFQVAVAGDEMIGCIGLEKYRDHGLLRSFAVKSSFRNQGIGSALLQSFLSYCNQEEVSNLHLLTIDAQEFFQSKGFQVADRDKAPESIRQTTEFTQLCPSSSAYMRLRIGY